jgi:AcrR family transcriptional regulator
MTHVSDRREPIAEILPGRRERRKAETKEKLFRTAMRLFAERGFFETTTEDITEAADVGLGTFFNYFPSKQHVLALLSEKQLEKVKSARRAAEAGTVPVREVLESLMHAIADEPGKSQALTRSLVTGLVSNDQVREIVRNTMAAGRAYIAEILAAGQERGEIRRDRDAASLAMAFQRSVLGTLLLWAIQIKGNLHAWLEETFTDFWAAAEVREDLKDDKFGDGSSKNFRKPQRTDS